MCVSDSSVRAWAVNHIPHNRGFLFHTLPPQQPLRTIRKEQEPRAVPSELGALFYCHIVHLTASANLKAVAKFLAIRGSFYRDKNYLIKIRRQTSRIPKKYNQGEKQSCLNNAASPNHACSQRKLFLGLGLRVLRCGMPVTSVFQLANAPVLWLLALPAA